MDNLPKSCASCLVRIKFKISDFFERGDRLTLKDLQQYLKEKKEINAFGEIVDIKVDGDKVQAHFRKPLPRQFMGICVKLKVN